MHGFRYARFTFFRGLRWLCCVGGLAGGCLLGFRWFGFIGAVIGAVLGLIVGLCLIEALEILVWQSSLREIMRCSTAELRTRIAEEKHWNLMTSMALLQLAARKENVEPDLPRILAMLESDSTSTRLFGQDAFRLVWTHLYEHIQYQAEESTALCREKIARLRADLADKKVSGQAP